MADLHPPPSADKPPAPGSATRKGSRKYSGLPAVIFVAGGLGMLAAIIFFPDLFPNTASTQLANLNKSLVSLVHRLDRVENVQQETAGKLSLMPSQEAEKITAAENRFTVLQEQVESLRNSSVQDNSSGKSERLAGLEKEVGYLKQGLYLLKSLALFHILKEKVCSASPYARELSGFLQGTSLETDLSILEKHAEKGIKGYPRDDTGTFVSESSQSRETAGATWWDCLKNRLGTVIQIEKVDRGNLPSAALPSSQASEQQAVIRVLDQVEHTLHEKLMDFSAEAADQELSKSGAGS